MTGGLAALQQRARDEINLFVHPDKQWVTAQTGPDGKPMRDVIIVGGGQSGLGVALALMRERIDNIEIIDESESGEEGPWITYARMLTLRTLKFLTGPDGGIPALTFRAWHEAQFGAESYDRMARIPRQEWMRYLTWLRQTGGIAMHSRVRVERIRLHHGPPALDLATPGGPELRYARKIVMANGIEGAGRRRVPALVKGPLPPARYAHTADPIDFSALAGKRIVVVGAGASAFDNAATALEHGAARVDMLIRRPVLPELNAFRVLESRGFYRNFGDAPDADRWRFMQRMLSLPMPPPQDTLERFRRHPNAHMHLGAPLLDAVMDGETMRLKSPHGWQEADFLILGTGFAVDLSLRPEFSEIAPAVATWADRYTPPRGENDPAVGKYPYLGPGFELLERSPGTLPGLKDIHLFNTGSVVSMGPVAGGVNGMPWGVPRLVQKISRDLFMPELDAAYAEFAAYDAPDPWEAVRAGTSPA